MPTLGNNLQVWKDYMLSFARKHYSSDSALRFLDGELFFYLNQAQAYFQEILRVDVAVNASFAVSENVYEYDWPEGSTRLDAMRFKKTGDDGYNPPLVEVDPSVMIDRYGVLQVALNTQTTGTPLYWCVSPSDKRKFWLAPVPDAGGTLYLNYHTSPRPLRRIYNQTTVTADMSTGSNTVTLSADPNATITQFIVGDEFGQRPLLLSDGQVLPTRAGQSPLAWHRITVYVPGTKVVTLADTPDDENTSAAGFIISQVSDLEQALPGRYSLAIPKMAAAEFLMKREPNLAAALKTDALTLLRDVDADPGGSEKIVARTIAGTPFAR